MKRTRYMNQYEMLDWFKIGIYAGDLDRIAGITDDIQWKEKLKSAASACEDIVNERLNYLDIKQVKAVKRRSDHTNVKFISSDDDRMKPAPENTEDGPITVNQLDIYDLADLALTACYACEQGKVVKDCPYRDVFHRLAIPVCREDVEDGQCEFRYDDDIEFVIPPYGKISYVVKRNGEYVNKKIKTE